MTYCIGGRSLYRGGWSPRLTSADLGARAADQVAWPEDAASYLLTNYEAVEIKMGVKPTTDYMSGSLFEKIERAIFRRAGCRSIG